MRAKFLYSFFALLLVNALFMGCKKDLTAIPNSLLPNEDIYTDKNLILSVLSRFYQQINGPNGAGQNGWGQNNDSWEKFQQDPDDGINNNGAPSSGNLTWGRDRYRAFDYGLIRRINQFLEGIRSEESRKSMTPAENANFEGQALFLRAYTYFWMVRTLGGITIVEDKVFDYTSGMDIVPYQLPRNSEEQCYQYILDQCDFAASKLTITDNNNVNRSLANKWAAKMLKARAALAAASIAKYTPIRADNNVKKDARGVSVVGIPVAKANEFYTTALATAQDVITNSGYSIMKSATNPEQAFYAATTLKAGNTEVIWATDRKAPGVNTQYTRYVAPVSAGHTDGQAEGNSLGATLNLVEAFENRDGSNTKIMDRDANNNYIIYDDVEAPFKAKDARLWGTVIWPNAQFRGTPVPLRAGELTKLTQPYTYSQTVPVKNNNTAPTGPNGPADVSNNYVNKTGFGVRKWLDETPNSGIGPNYSEVWWPRFRLAEAYMIAAEAAFELGDLGTAVTNINVLRDRGRIQPLTTGTITFDKIVNENRVEFAFEDHRVWDLIRWRLAHIYWNSKQDDPVAQAMALYAYRINVTGNPNGNNGKWVFERKRAYRRNSTPFTFTVDSYYSTISRDWINPNNPNWVLNPGQN